MSGPQRSSSGLRAIHALVFLGISAAGALAVWPELLHLAHAWAHRLHAGDPPMPIALLAAVLLLAGTLGLLIALAQRRSAPLAVSALILFGALLGGYTRQLALPRGRTTAAANLAVLDAGRKVHQAFVDRLQQRGFVTADAALWARAFDTQPSPLRDRLFRPRPFATRWVERPEARPTDLEPGTFLLYVSPDGVGFTITPVGFDERGEAALLRNDDGEVVALRGLYNPNLPAQKPSPPGRPAGL